MVTFYEYSYGSDPRGMLVRKHSYYNDGHAVFDVTTDLLYAADGRLLEATKSPPDVVGFGGNEVHRYDSQGRLIQSKEGRTIISYDKHDNYGNWTERRVEHVREVRIFAYY
jgi:hypothetical protein